MTGYVFVHGYDPMDSSWYPCTVLASDGGQATIELAPESPTVSGYIGMDGLGYWPGPGVQMDGRAGVWVPFPPPAGYEPRQPARPEPGSRRITVPKELVHRDPGPWIGQAGHPDYPYPVVQRIRTRRARIARRLRKLVGAA